MEYQELINYIEHVGKDPSRLIFEDELTGIHNRRFLLQYFQSKVSWDSLEEDPLSLIMIDLDHFKAVNDTYGHQMGDQALTWLANLLKEVAGDQGIPVRYAGDEFMICLPSQGKESALTMGENLLERVRQEPFRSDELDAPQHITVSIGIASAPDDAQHEKGLIHKADTALYFAKKAGRDRIADAGELVRKDVLARTALYQLEGIKLVGRKQQLAQVNAAIKRFSKRKSQFLIAEGAAGMGKSEFLKTIHHGLARSKIQQVRVRGASQELFRPYYLMTNILVEILSQREDKGASALEDLSTEAVACLSHILPQLGGTETMPPAKDEKAHREAIFSALVRFVPKAANNRPLILLIDDMHLADEASLMVLRELMLSHELHVFICGTYTDTQQSKAQEEMGPLKKFCETCCEELDIRKLTLTPLTDSDVANHIQEIFPRVSLPEDFEKKLAQITHGNPLFVAEILRKLILDQKISLVGQQWVIARVENDYLPRSLEEIVNQKIAALDEKSKQLLDQVSTFGEDVSLSALVGSSEKMEAQVLEFVDQAVTQGLLTTDFQLNDETIRFLSKRVLEIAYGTIEDNRKQELHNRIGEYQETLYQQHLLPSAATLAYHFKRSADQGKAKKYEQTLASSSSQIFSHAEASRYAADKRREILARAAPLDPDSLEKVPTLIRHLLTAVRNHKLYPPGSKSIIKSNRQLEKSIDRILKDNQLLNIVKKNRVLLINGKKVNVSGFRFVSEAFFDLLAYMELEGIAFHRGLSENELQVLLEAFGRTKPRMIEQHFWERFSAKRGLVHVDLQQVRYAMIGQGEPAKHATAAQDNEVAAPVEASSKLLVDRHRLNQQELAHVPEVIRCLLSAIRTVKLYPQNSKALSTSAEQILKVLSSVFSRQPLLAMAGVDDSLLVNGERVDTTNFQTLADNLVQLFDAIQLASLTFLEPVTVKELETFVGALTDLPADVSSEFWVHFAKDCGLSNILFDQHVYEIFETRVAPTVLNPARDQIAQGSFLDQTPGGLPQGPAVQELLPEKAIQGLPPEGVPKPAPPERVPEELFQAFVETIPDQMSDLLLKDDQDKTKQMIRRLFQELQNRDPMNREKVVHVCRRSLETQTMALQCRFAGLVVDPLLFFFLEETDPKIVLEIAGLLHRMATNLIDLGEYPLASRFLLHLQMRQEQLEQSNDPTAQQLGNILDRKLEPTTEKLLVQDLNSDKPSQRQNAALLLGSLGRVVMPLLIDIIKQEDNLRTRKIASGLLQEMGPKPAGLLKRALVLEITARERIRILEVIDTLTRDLKNELPVVLSDADPDVREAAFGVAERLNDPYVVELLLECAKSQETNLATAAIRGLGRLKTKSAAGDLLSILSSSRDQEKLIASCRALGQIADPASVEILAKTLAPNGLLSLRRRRSSQLRAAAAFALANIPEPSASEVLARFVEDRDPRVREVAVTTVNNTESPPSP